MVREEDDVIAVLSAGYRYEPPDGVQARIGFALHLGAGSLAGLIPLPYASLGWTF